MALRQDAFQGLVEFATAINEQLADIVTPATVWTIGHVSIHPNAASIVPGRVDFNIQWRDAEDERLDRMQEVMRDCASRIARERGLVLERSAYSTIQPTRMDRKLMTRISAASERLAEGRWRHPSRERCSVSRLSGRERKAAHDLWDGLTGSTEHRDDGLAGRGDLEETLVW